MTRGRFDVLAASHGAASLGLIAIFLVSGVMVMFEPTELRVPIGAGLLVVAAVYLVSILVVGNLAGRRSASRMRFSFRGGSHGAAGFCIVSMLSSAGFLTLFEQWSNVTALSVALLAIGITCAVGMIWFGLISAAGTQRNDDSLGGEESNSEFPA